MGNELVSSILSYALSVFMGAAVVAASVPLVHILQLESYQGKMYLKWLMKHIGSDFVPSFVAGAAALALRAGYVLIGGTNPLIGRICYYLADIVYIAMLAVIYFSYEKSRTLSPSPIRPRKAPACGGIHIGNAVQRNVFLSLALG